VYRLHFTTQDLLRVRIADPPDPFFETVLAAEQARQSASGLAFRGWRAGLRGRLNGRTRPLTELFSRDGPGLDLSTLVGPVTTMEEGVDGLYRVRPDAMAAELRSLAGHRRLTPWACALAGVDPAPRRRLADALGAFHEAAVRPYWAAIAAHLRAERTLRTHCLASAGLDHLLATMCPDYVRWRPPVLEINTPYRSNVDLVLGGRGLVLVPSVFVGRRPYLAVDLTDDAVPPRLILPTLRDLGVARRVWHTDRSHHHLAALLGRTRSAVLAAIADGSGTGEIARRLGVSAATVSQHTAVLRASRLITTRRDGATALHVLTGLGAALLDDGDASDGGRYPGRDR
jgi:predicted transcriptional regulator